LRFSHAKVRSTTQRRGKISKPFAWSDRLMISTFQSPILVRALRNLSPAYGLSAPFRQGLSERGLVWAVGIPHKQKGYPADVGMIFPVSGRGRPRERHIPDVKSITPQAMLEGAKWQTVSWRKGTKDRLSTRFAVVRVRVADGPTQRIHDMGAQHLPSEEVWVIGEHRSTGERKYYLSNLPAGTPIKDLASAIKARWVCEQAHQQLKEELGLDHLEGRSWQGLHRHCLMCMIALAFLQSQRLQQASGEKRIAGPPPQPTLPAVRQAIPNALAQPPPTACPYCQRSINFEKVPK
jgi:SRSO17 transposase